MISIPRGFRQIWPGGPGFERGMLWPAFDVKCSRVIFNMADDLDEVMKYLQPNASRRPTGPQRRVCIQAGGNCGVWPIKLSSLFDTVYTAEPDPQNFTALAFNTAHLPNVVRLQAAFGFERDKVKTALDDHELDNCGAYYLERGGYVPTIRIDDLNAHGVDLIYLDIEGFERIALEGADNTIRRCRPLIVIEDKGLSERYGSKQGDCEKWLEKTFDYVVLKRVHRDVILGYAADFMDIG